MSLRIACDLDGTLADMESALQREAERIFGNDVDARPLDARERSRLWSHLREIDNFWETLPEIETGAVRRLADIASAQGWEVFFITRRPDTAGDTVQVQSQRWLEKYGFERPRVDVVSGSRGSMAASLSLDAVIDDSPENCVDVMADSRATPLLVWRDAPDRLPPGLSRLPIHVVSSLAEAIEYLTRPAA